jgi:hypothetical protein
LIELADPEQVLGFLREAVVRRSAEGGRGEFHQMEGQEAWIYTFNLLDMAHVHLRVAIEDGYLMISNLPWSQRTDVKDISVSAFDGAQMHVNFGAITEQLPALHTKAYTDYRSAAVDGMGYLYPLLAIGVAGTAEEAAKKHAMLFGFRPVHPVAGRWIWKDGQLKSSVFGSALRPVQPEYARGDRSFGLFPTVDSLDVNLQLEDTGLRTQVRWRLAED